MTQETDQSIFGQGGEQPPTESPEAVANPFADKLKTITREDGTPKYETVEAALDALPHANQHISTLEQELAKLREEKEAQTSELLRAKGALEAVDRLVPQGQPTPVNAEPPAAAPAQEEAVDVTEIARQAALEAVNQDRTVAVEKANLASVVEQISQQYGDTAEQRFYGKAEELGMSREEINALARTKPKAVLALFPEVKQGTVNVGSSTLSVPASKTPERNADGSLPAPERSVLVGANSKDLINEWKRHKPAND